MIFLPPCPMAVSPTQSGPVSRGPSPSKAGTSTIAPKRFRGEATDGGIMGVSGEILRILGGARERGIDPWGWGMDRIPPSSQF